MGFKENGSMLKVSFVYH